MSRIGNLAIALPKGVEATVKGSEVTVKGPKGTLTQSFNPEMKITADKASIKVQRPSDERGHKAVHGLTRALIANMVTGASQGYTKSLELVGVGYRVQPSGKGVSLSLMYSHTVDVQPVAGVTLEVEGTTKVHVKGIDRQVVGQLAAKIRGVKPPNAYTGKGIRYVGEQVRLKPGKSARRAA
ncbi:MAG: 50S ribosomal protein L6 [SAR202 cluster bacterium]|nr:50S ribosomal protein L6 [SAR202 cluster bacterium]